MSEYQRLHAADGGAAAATSGDNSTSSEAAAAAAPLREGHHLLTEASSAAAYTNTATPAKQQAPTQTQNNGRREIRNLLHLAVSFFLVFTAFSGISNIESTVVKVPNVGFYSIAMLYFVFAATCLVTPALVRLAGPRCSMVAAFACFVLFCVANVLATIHPTPALVWPCLLGGGALTGLGASFLWTAQGAYLTANAKAYAIKRGLGAKAALGMFSGIFFGIFQLTQVSGNLLESLLLPYVADTVLFVVYLAICGAGLVLTAFLRPAAAPAEVDGDEPQEEGAGAASCRELLLATVRLWRDPKLLLMVPLMFLSGLEQGWVSGAFTEAFVAPSVGVQNLGFVLTVFGAVNAAASAILGRVSDAVGRGPVLVFGGAAQAMVALLLLLIPVGDKDWPKLLLAAAGWGLGDAVWNTQLYAMLGDMFAGNVEGAFANFKLFQSSLSGIAWLLGSLLKESRATYLWLLLGFIVVGVPTALVALRWPTAGEGKAAGSAASTSTSRSRRRGSSVQLV